MAISVSQEDLLDAMRQAMGSPGYGEGQTGPEIAAILGVCATTARGAIKKLLSSGRLETVTVRRQTMNGNYTSIIGYRPKT